MIFENLDIKFYDGIKIIFAFFEKICYNNYVSSKGDQK